MNGETERAPGATPIFYAPEERLPLLPGRAAAALRYCRATTFTPPLDFDDERQRRVTMFVTIRHSAHARFCRYAATRCRYAAIRLLMPPLHDRHERYAAAASAYFDYMPQFYAA